MKRLFVILLFSMVATNAFADCKLTMRVTEYPPQYFQDENGKWSGIAVELGTALAKEAGCQIIYKSMKWSTALISLKKGGLDLLLNLSYTEEREKFINFIGPARYE